MAIRSAHPTAHSAPASMIDRPGRRSSYELAVLLGIAILLLSLILIGPHIWPASAIDQDGANRLQGSSLAHPLGTDQYGRDLLARLLAGGRWTLLGGGLVTLGVTVTGLFVAAIAVSSGRTLDIIIGRMIDTLLAVPNLVIALAIAAVLGPSYANLILALIVAGWPWYARAWRSAMLREREAGYVEGAIVTGAHPARVIVRHIGPNIVGQILILSTTNLGFVILNLAALSFVGLGVQPPTPEWGAMINEARPFFQSHPLQMIVPGVAIVLTVVLINLIGDAVRDRLDPRLHAR